MFKCETCPVTLFLTIRLVGKRAELSFTLVQTISFPESAVDHLEPLPNEVIPHTRERSDVPGLGWRPNTLAPMATASRPDPTDQGDPGHRGSTFCQARNGCRVLRALQEVPPSWAAFAKVLEDRFMPSDIKNSLTEELG